MKFSTIVKYQNTWNIFSGATFVARNIGDTRIPAQIVSPAVYNNVWELQKAGGEVCVSNDLLLASDVSIHRDPTAVTIMRAAWRDGEPPMLVPESEATKCEIQKHAHAVWIPADPNYYPHNGHDYRPYVLLESAESTQEHRILMPGLALLTEGAQLSVRIVHAQKRDLGVFKGYEKVEVPLAQFTVSYDGSNLKVEGVQISHPAQECFV